MSNKHEVTVTVEQLDERKKPTGVILSKSKKSFFSIYNAEKYIHEVEDSASLHDGKDRKTTVKIKKLNG